MLHTPFDSREYRQFMQDERFYPNPSRFDPGRFLSGSYGGLGIEDYNPLNVIFGFGRR